MAERLSAKRRSSFMRKLYGPIGFTKGYNFAFWFIFSAAMLGFCLARFMYFNFNGVFCSPNNSGANHAASGECYWYTSFTAYRVGIALHLYTILPAGFLACVQFIPVVRHKLILVHRINGYVVVLLSVVGTAGAIMIAPVAFGGGVDIQGIVGLLAVMFVGSLGLAYYNIKRLQIEQHRAWMLRAWFYAASIITCRFIMSLTSIIISSSGQKPYYKAKLCHELSTILNATALVQSYPTCTSLDSWVLVKADMNADSPEHRSAAFDLTFGMALWLALAIHAIGIELYLRLTPAEAERLRNVSYQRQLEAGSAKLRHVATVTDQVGDSEGSVQSNVMSRI